MQKFFLASSCATANGLNTDMSAWFWTWARGRDELTYGLWASLAIFLSMYAAFSLVRCNDILGRAYVDTNLLGNFSCLPIHVDHLVYKDFSLSIINGRVSVSSLTYYLVLSSIIGPFKYSTHIFIIQTRGFGVLGFWGFGVLGFWG